MNPIKPVISAVSDSGLSPNAKTIMLTLCSIASPGFEAWPGRRWLAAHTGMAPTTAWNQLRILVRAGWLVDTGRRRNLAKVYRIRIPSPCPAPGCRLPEEHRGLHDIPAGLPSRAGGWASGAMRPTS